MGISNDAQIDVDEFGAASAELKQFPWDQKFIAWEAEARYDLEFRIGSLEQEVYTLRRENDALQARAEKAEAMVEWLIEAVDGYFFGVEHPASIWRKKISDLVTEWKEREENGK